MVFESIDTMDQPRFAAWVESRAGHDDNHYELLNGRVVMTPPAGWPHGGVEAQLVARMVSAAARGNHGKVCGSSQGFELPTGDTVEPDASFISTARWRAATPIEGKFLRLVPDLVVEIVSPSTASRDRGEKKGIYAAAGVREYVLVDSRARTITVFTSIGMRFDGGRIHYAREPWTSAALPGLSLWIADLVDE